MGAGRVFKYLSGDEQECENHFTDNFERDKNGRFVVSVPYKHLVERLGESKTGALKRFYLMKRRLESKPRLKNEYVKFMK